eukprot:TRINITY_DN74336_c0_g1_i1.p1 TRINITY_DN74336_c0_g1~~TRINITY_DN74336_c0_g1_i1.p1  ORF type:complete len:465 (+),score=31.49 TRINITY_DN74336_c0_g1_i1:90-1484(+)
MVVDCDVSYLPTLLAALFSLILPTCAYLEVASLLRADEHRRLARESRNDLHGNVASSASLTSFAASDTVRSPEQERIAVFDNVRFFMVALLVFTHSPITQYPFHSNIYQIVSPFHVKCLAFTSGVLARKPPSASTWRTKFYRIFMVNILWCLVGNPILVYITTRDSPSDRPDLLKQWQSGFYATNSPNWILWGLIWWNVGGLLLWDLPPCFRVFVAILFCAAGGYSQSEFFSFSYSISTLPVFVFGQVFPWERAVSITRADWLQGLRGGFMLVLLCVPELVPVVRDFMEEIPQYSWYGGDQFHWKYGPDSSCDLPLGWTLSVWIRGAVFRNVLEVSKVLLLLLYVLPKGRHFTARLGRFWLYPLLLHRPLLDLSFRWLEELKSRSDFVQKALGWGCLAMLCQVVFALALTAILSTWPVRALFWVIIEPTWLERGVRAIERYETKVETQLPSNQAHASHEVELSG